MSPLAIKLVMGVVSGSLALLLAAGTRGKASYDPVTRSLRFRHSLLFRGISVVVAVTVPILLTILVFIFPPKTDSDTTAVFALYMAFAVLGGPLLWESMRFRMLTSAEGLDCMSPWRRHRFIPWSDV